MKNLVDKTANNDFLLKLYAAYLLSDEVRQAVDTFLNEDNVKPVRKLEPTELDDDFEDIDLEESALISTRPRPKRKVKETNDSPMIDFGSF